MPIEREVGGSKGCYVIRRGSADLFRRRRQSTGVPDSFRGAGVGKALVERMIADARAEGVKIVPQCPFVNAQRARHPKWADVFPV